jgi:hypothetical protein
MAATVGGNNCIGIGVRYFRCRHLGLGVLGWFVDARADSGPKIATAMARTRTQPETPSEVVRIGEFATHCDCGLVLGVLRVERELKILPSYRI